MGESLGLERSRVLGTPPLPSTRDAVEEWNEIATQQQWVSALAAMHSLELIANRDLVNEGASVRYFDPRYWRGRRSRTPPRTSCGKGTKRTSATPTKRSTS